MKTFLIVLKLNLLLCHRISLLKKRKERYEEDKLKFNSINTNDRIVLNGEIFSTALYENKRNKKDKKVFQLWLERLQAFFYSFN